MCLLKFGWFPSLKGDKGLSEEYYKGPKVGSFPHLHNSSGKSPGFKGRQMTVSSQKQPAIQKNSCAGANGLLHSTLWRPSEEQGHTMAYHLSLLLTTVLYSTVDPCIMDRLGQLLMNMFQNVDHCLNKQIHSQHLTPPSNSIFPLSHLCLHKKQVQQGQTKLLWRCTSAAQHSNLLTACVYPQLLTVTN